MISTPCKDCKRRTITCHGICKEYQSWKKQHQENVEAQRQRNVWPGVRRAAIKRHIDQNRLECEKA